MTMLDVTTVGLQIVLPLLLVALIVVLPARSRAGFIVQVAATGLMLLALLLAAVWMIPPWWVPYSYLGLLVLAVIRVARRAGLPVNWWPQSWRGWMLPASFLLLGIWGASVAADALMGRQIPPGTDVVDLAFPLGPGSYLVASGGAHESVNGHFITLHPKTDRQRAYRGQSYGIDLIMVDRWGLRTSGWRPSDPAAYAIFGEPVFAPCNGQVLRAHDGMPDMQVPRTDTALLEGNHVVLKCADKAVVLGHFRKGSVRVSEGARVQSGDQIGEVGNSGQSTEPHLHVHAQDIPQAGPLLSGEPSQLTFDGRFPVRNDRVSGGRRSCGKYTWNNDAAVGCASRF
jgi:Peptidase family M23